MRKCRVYTNADIHWMRNEPVSQILLETGAWKFRAFSHSAPSQSPWELQTDKQNPSTGNITVAQLVAWINPTKN